MRQRDRDLIEARRSFERACALDPANGYFVRLLLEVYGHRVTLAATGPAGVEAARRAPPEVVLCDLGLPGMDGYEVARALRADPATAGARLIALSGYGHDDDRQHSRAAGFERHLVKPVDPTDILRLLASAPAAPAG